MHSYRFLTGVVLSILLGGTVSVVDLALAGQRSDELAPLPAGRVVQHTPQHDKRLRGAREIPPPRGALPHGTGAAARGAARRLPGHPVRRSARPAAPPA